MAWGVGVKQGHVVLCGRAAARGRKRCPRNRKLRATATLPKCKSVPCGRVGGGGEPAPGVPVLPVTPRCVVRRLAGGRGAGGLMVSHLVC